MYYKKYFSRIMCVVLSLCFVMETVPPTTYASAADLVARDDQVEQSEDGDIFMSIPKETENLDADRPVHTETTGIVGEIKEDRSARSKRFLLSDGSIAAVSYPMDVNYMDHDGTWKEINNNFLYSESNSSKSDFAGLETSEGAVKFKFADTTEEDTLVRVTEDNYQIDFTMITSSLAQEAETEVNDEAAEDNNANEIVENLSERAGSRTEKHKSLNDDPANKAGASVESNSEKASGIDNTSGVEDNATESEQEESIVAEESDETAIAVVAANVSKGDVLSELPDSAQVTQRQTDANEKNMTTPDNPFMAENTCTELVYSDVLPNVSLSYATMGSSLKENIVVSAPMNEYVFHFRMNLKNLVPEYGNDGSIYLNDKKTGKSVYHIPTAYMIDSNDGCSEEVEMTVSQTTDGHFLLTVIADESWINEKGRSFPITIDPTLEKTTADSNDFEIRDVYVVEKNADNNFGYTKKEGWIGYSPGTHSGASRMFCEFRRLPDIPTGSVISNANIFYWQYSYDNYPPSNTDSFAIDVRDVTSDLNWDSGVTWNTQPSLSNIVVDSKYVSEETAGGYVGWNITSIVKKKYEEGNNDEFAAVAFTADNESSLSTTDSCATVHFYKATNTTSKPYIVITYRDTYGLEDYYSCQTHEICEAGTAYVGDYNSQLTLEETDYSNNSEAISFSLEHYYNSGMCKGQFGVISPYAKDYSDMKVGCGWKLNAQQTVVETTISNETYYVYTDGDGTEHYFSEDPDEAGKYVDEDDLGLSIIKNGSDFTMTDGTTTTLFCDGYLTSMTDSYGNVIYFVYNNSSYGSESDSWKPTDGAHCLTSIVQVNTADNTPQTLVTLTYNDSTNYLTSITDKAGNVTTYTYSNYNLTKITRPDATTLTYTYASNHYLQTATDNNSKYGVAYAWKTLGCRVLVSRIREYSTSTGSKVYGSDIKVNGDELQHTVYTYCGNDRTFNTEDDQISTYTFDHAGRTVNVCTKDLDGNVLGVEAGSYSNSNAKNSLTASASLGQQAPNEILNGSGEYTSSAALNMGSWAAASATNGSAVASTAEHRHGKRSYALTGNNASNSSVGVYGTRTLDPGTYSYSAYVKTRDIASFGTNGGASMQLSTNTAGTNVVSKSDVVNYVTSEDSDNGWVRISGKYTLTARTKLYIFLKLTNTKGTAYFDDLQMETTPSNSQFNLLENGSLITSNRWAMDTDGASCSKDQVLRNVYCFKILGDLDACRAIRQNVPINQVVANQSYVLSGWAKANALPNSAEDNFNGDSRFFGLSARFIYSDGSYETQFLPFNTDVTDWQYASTVITPTQKGKILSAIRVRCEYSYNANTAYYDCLSLTEEVTSLYDYDSKGNLISSVYGSSNTTYTYDEDGNVLTATDENGNTTHFQYDEDGNLTGMSTNSFAVEDEENSTGTETTTSIVGEDGTSYSIGSTYTSNGNHVATETANTGAVTTYDYNNSTDYLTSVTDALGVTTEYTYVSGNGNTASASLKDSDNNLVVALNYTYSNGNLTALQRTGTRAGSALAQTFSFAYDGWNHLTSVQAGDHTLANYTYGSGNGNLSKMTYGNGTEESYTYNSLDQVTEISYNGSVSYKYTYTNDGNVETVTDVANNVVFRYRYDNGGNVIGFTRSKNGQTQLSAVNWTSTDGFTTGTRLNMDGTSYNTSSTKDSQTGNVMTFHPLTGNDVVFTYDSLSQLLTRKNGLFQQGYTYKQVTNASGGTETTGQIFKIEYAKQGSSSFGEFALSYEYDLLGNITKVSDASGNVLAQYSYDAQSQLLSETLPQQDKRYEYTYDTAGNILTVATYTASGTTPTQTDSYTYGDSTWNDLLTKFNGQNITYDNGGNPLTYNNGNAWKFTWQKGRQLANAKSGSTTLSFTYDADGIRDTKTVNGTTHNYLTMDGTIYQEKWGNNTLTFAYDENGLPCSVTYNGTTYYYVLNQQGDVIRIVNASGSTQAEYTYDAWGNVIASTDTTSGIGSVNPLRYRGYYWDAELGMYYLQSRYYDPVVKRFVNSDDIQELDESCCALGLNLFAFCYNNPTNKSDYTGRVAYKVVTSIISGIVSVLIFYVFSGLLYYVKNGKTLSGFTKKISKKRIAWEFAGGIVSNLINISGMSKKMARVVSGLVAGFRSAVDSWYHRSDNWIRAAIGDFAANVIIAVVLADTGFKNLNSNNHYIYNYRIQKVSSVAYLKVGSNSLKICRQTLKPFAKSMASLFEGYLLNNIYKKFAPKLGMG